MAWHGIPQGTAWIATAPLGSPESAPPRALRAAAPTARSAAVPPGARRGRRAAPRPGFSANQAGFGDVNPQTYEYLNIKHLSQQKSRKWRKCGDVSSSAWCFPTFSHLFGCQLLGIFPFHREPRARDEAAVVDVAGHQGEEAAALQLLDLVIDLLQLS